MVFESQTGLLNLYNIVDYCLDRTRCRRAIIASYFDQPWSDTECNRMCDHCKQDGGGMVPKKVDIGKHARTLCSILNHVSGEDINVTAAMLMDLWYKQKVAKVKNVAAISSFQAPTFPRETGENIIAHLLINKYLKQDFHFTPYSTISYLKLGPKARLLDDSDHTVVMTVVGKGDNKTKENRNVDEGKKNSKPSVNSTNKEANDKNVCNTTKDDRNNTKKHGEKSNSRSNNHNTTNDERNNVKKTTEKSNSRTSQRNIPNKITAEVSLVSDEIISGGSNHGNSDEDMVELSGDDKDIIRVENIETVTLGEDSNQDAECSVVSDDEKNSEAVSVEEVEKTRVEVDRETNKRCVKKTNDTGIGKGSVEKANKHFESPVSEKNRSRRKEESTDEESRKSSSKRKEYSDEDDEKERNNKRRKSDLKIEQFLQDQKRRRTSETKGNVSIDSQSLQDMIDISSGDES
ncbi:hypothetical protein WDU94_007072 [Cyamophila willieti]